MSIAAYIGWCEKRAIVFEFDCVYVSARDREKVHSGTIHLVFMRNSNSAAAVTDGTGHESKTNRFLVA